MKKISIFVIFTLFSFSVIASDNPIVKVKTLKNKIESLERSQIYDELIKMKKTIVQDYNNQKKLKETTLDEVGIMFDIQAVLELITENDKKKIDCAQLKNSLIVDYKEKWDEMPEGVKLIWPIIQKCCQ